MAKGAGSKQARRERSTPHETTARQAAHAALVAVLRDGQSLTRALPQASASLAEDRERAFAYTLTAGTLRYLTRLEAILATLVRRPLKAREVDVRATLLLGLYQLAYLDTPAHAAVSESVQLLPANRAWAKGLTNAVLRRFIRERTSIENAVDQDPSARLACPSWLLEAFETSWPGTREQIARASNAPAPMTLRVNRRRTSREEFLLALEGADITAHPLYDLPDAITLSKPCDPRTLPGFEAGWFSVQDGSAQRAAPLLAAEPGMRVLDACAAPGGKATHLLELVPDLALTCVELSPERAARVQENLQRLGAAATVVVADAANPSAWWDGKPFERILLDVPCTGTGIIRRHPDIKHLRRPSDLAQLTALQSELLDALWPTLADGGLLLYATCSLLRSENAVQMERFLERHTGAREVPIDGRLPDSPSPDRRSGDLERTWGQADTVGRQILPGDHPPDDFGRDGFYYACVRKDS